MQVTVYVDYRNFELAKAGCNFDATLVPHENYEIAMTVPLKLITSQTIRQHIDADVHGRKYVGIIAHIRP